MKLTADDIYVDQWMGVLPKEDFTIKIYCKEMSVGKALKKEILDNQEKADRGEELLIIYKDMRKTVFELEQQIKELKEAFNKQVEWNVLNQMNITTAKQAKIENQKNKEIVERLKETINDQSWIKYFGEKEMGIYLTLKEILGETG